MGVMGIDARNLEWGPMRGGKLLPKSQWVSSLLYLRLTKSWWNVIASDHL